MDRAVFLDRDGVIIENRADYVRSWADVQFLPGALGALERLAATDYKIVVVTNQSVVGRGILGLEDARQINTQVVGAIARAGGRVDAVYMCPHAPLAGCNCRKPRPGLIYQAAGDLALDLTRSVLIGDALTDLQAAAAAGIPRRLLVLTGRGAEQQVETPESQAGLTEIFPDLAGAVQALLDGVHPAQGHG